MRRRTNVKKYYSLGLVLAAVIIGSVGCGSTIAGPSAVKDATPVVTVDASHISIASVAAGTTWTGISHSTSHGHDGSLAVAMTANSGNNPASAPANPGNGNGNNDNSLSATVTWTQSGGSITYTGAVTGSVDHVNINAASPASCNYKAVGALNAAGTTMTGTYEGVAGASCQADAGTFTITKQ
jgi:hypothetical protein